jgi:hypothetical protein
MCSSCPALPTATPRSLRRFLRYPPNTPQKQKDLGAWFGKNPPAGVAGRLPELVKALEAKNPSIKSWGVLGVSKPQTPTSKTTTKPTLTLLPPPNSSAGAARS